MVELFVTGVLAGNALQAFYYVQYPSPPPRIVPTTSITPAKPSSPLVSCEISRHDPAILRRVGASKAVRAVERNTGISADGRPGLTLLLPLEVYPLLRH